MPRLRFLLVLALIVISTLALGRAKAQMPTARNESLSRNFVLRLLNWSASGVQILEGRLPERLPVELPLPEQTQILGSVVGPKEDVQILLDVGQSPEQVVAFYRERLLAAGWRKPEPETKRLSERGFVQTRPENGFEIVDFSTPLVVAENGDITRAGRTDVFCQGSFGPLFIEARPMPKATTDVRLNLYLSSFNSYCSSNHTNQRWEVPLPPLTPPSHTKVELRGSRGSNHDWESMAMLETSLDVQALAAHYTAQLQRVGWIRRDSGQSSLSAWSNWLLKDNKGQSWQGMLNLSQVEGKANQYFASVRLFRI